MSAHPRRVINRLNRWTVPCAIALWTVIPAPPAIGQVLDFADDPAATPPAEEPTNLSADDVAVSEFMEVTLHVQDTDLSKVLQMLSIQSQRNIIASKNVSATISADLYNVSFYEALEALLHVNGYGFTEDGNFIYVWTQEELRQMEEAARQVITTTIDLNYISAADAAVFVTPALSEAGSIAMNGPVGAGISVNESDVGDESYALAGKLVVTDYPENVDEIKRVVAELDTRPAQVLVEATIVQTALTEQNAFGVDFSIIADVNFSDFTLGPLSTVPSLRAGASPGGNGIVPSDNRGSGVESTVGNTAGEAGFRVGVVHDDFSIFMRLLDEVTDSTILSSPKVLCLNRQRARVQVGRNIGYLSTTATDTSTTQTVEFLPTGTTLTFRPFISNDGMIRMELAPRVSEGIIRDVTNATGATVTIPDEITQELTTNVIVREGSTIVLGGLFRENTSLARRQVPFLGDLPLVGAAFRGHDDETTRDEIIFMVKPSVVNDNVLVAQGERAMEFADQARTGIRRGTLPWSRDRQTAALNLDAERYVREGDLDKALWSINRSLSVHPAQPQAIALREKLLNERDRWPNRSMLEDIVDGSYHEAIEELGVKAEEIREDQRLREELRMFVFNLQQEKVFGEAWTEMAASGLYPDAPKSAPVVQFERSHRFPRPVLRRTEVADAPTDDVVFNDQFQNEFDESFPTEGSENTTEVVTAEEPFSEEAFIEKNFFDGEQTEEPAPETEVAEAPTEPVAANFENDANFETFETTSDLVFEQQDPFYGPLTPDRAFQITMWGFAPLTPFFVAPPQTPFELAAEPTDDFRGTELTEVPTDVDGK
jgi:type IV pilus assembly protein PilQ